MLGFGGSELFLILIIVLMLFGSDKVPEIARTLGKFMAQLKNATNDIKNEIQKGAEANGIDSNLLSDIKNNINDEITSVKSSVLKQSIDLKGITEDFSSELNKVSNVILNETPMVSKQPTTPTKTDPSPLADEANLNQKEEDEAIVGPIKRKQ